MIQYRFIINLDTGILNKSDSYNLLKNHFKCDFKNVFRLKATKGMFRTFTLELGGNQMDVQFI